MTASVVFSTFNRRHLLERTLPALFAQDVPADQLEIVVAVDGSTDGTADWLRGLDSPFPLRLILQPNRGQAAGLNAALSTATGDLALVLDDDVLCPPRLVSEHVAAHEAGLAEVIAGPVLVAPESPRSLAAEWERRDATRSHERQTREGPRWPSDMRVAANTSAPRCLLLEAGGFDASLRRAFDEDLGLRLHASGARFGYAATAMAWQLYERGAAELATTDARRYGRAQATLGRRFPTYRSYTPLAWIAEGRPLVRLLRRLAALSSQRSQPATSAAFHLLDSVATGPVGREAGLACLRAVRSAGILAGASHAAGGWPAIEADFGRRLPVLLYHHVGAEQAGAFAGLTIQPERFERHLASLAKQGFTTVSCARWLAWRRGEQRLPPKPLLITFDDAYADIGRYALPMLERHGFSATIFVVTGQIGGVNAWDVARGTAALPLMAADDIRCWARRGFEIGSHSVSHPELSDVGAAELAAELDDSLACLAELVGSAPIAFAYPYGVFDATIQAVVARRYQLAFTTEEGANTLRTDPLLLRRTQVLPTDTAFGVSLRARLGWSPIEHAAIRGARLKQRLGVA
ncbi:MAG: polysaccharide deacetylase family protein [Chloroflexi bacterium]|nr:polysaccharide deacetylase family protein [Chloroflexota bacterium]